MNIEETNLKAGFTADEAQWYKLEEVPELLYDHQDILNFTLDLLQKRVKQEPIGFNMLPDKFTLFQLQLLYESILGIKLDKPNFRRKITKMNLLIDTGETENQVSYRAAKLYRFDKEVYQSLSDRKLILDF